MQIITTPMHHCCAALMIMILLLALSGNTAQAQSEVPKVEVGGHFSLLHLPRNQRGFDTTATGGGGRGTFNLNANVGLEGEVNFYPEINPLRPVLIDSPAVAGLFGVKAGWRAEKAGVFIKIRPGFIHFEETIDPRIVFINPPPKPRNPHFALDLGGVLEFYPARRVVVRFDVGDTIIRFRYTNVLLGESRFTQHNLQCNAGIGFRFF
jgi:hypothetical protein